MKRGEALRKYALPVWRGTFALAALLLTIGYLHRGFAVEAALSALAAAYFIHALIQAIRSLHREDPE